MGYTNRKYPVKEIAIITINYPDDNGGERAKEGDIITVRNPHHVIGLKERTNYLWLRVEGLEENDCNNLNMDGGEGGVRYDKRRYCIPLHKLIEVFPSFDISRARNITDEYQPFMMLDEDSGEYLSPVKPFSVNGLVFDKITGEYL